MRTSELWRREEDQNSKMTIRREPTLISPVLRLGKN